MDKGAFLAPQCKTDLDPQIHKSEDGKTLQVPDGVDVDALLKVLGNPEMTALLSSLAKAIK